MASPDVKLSPLGGKPDEFNQLRKRRKVHHKVKTGCQACKNRRQKCDERKPICTGCDRFSTECIYRIPERSRPQETDSPNATPPEMGAPVCASPGKTLPVSPSTDLNLGDLELLHQYLTSTCIANGQLPEITVHVQQHILPLAQAFPFVMRGVLAMAATHLSWLRPSRHEHYAEVAAKNHHCGLSDFRQALQDINAENCQAVISYSKSLLWCSFADDEATSTRPTKLAPGKEENWLPQWFRLLQGSCHVVESSRPWITDGPHLLYGPNVTLDYSKNTDDDQLSLLASQMQLITGSLLCRRLLDTLRESFARAAMDNHNTPIRNAINYWTGSLPREYIRLLQKKEPWALVVLAHFCILIHRIETGWFMKGHGARLVRTITESLDDTWRNYVQWPCIELGIESFG